MGAITIFAYKNNVKNTKMTNHYKNNQLDPAITDTRKSYSGEQSLQKIVISDFVNDELSQRKHPAHTPLITRHNRTDIIFVTVCAKDRKKVFANERAHQIIAAIWRQSDKWAVGQYVFMPDHIHFFCAPTEWNGVSLKHWISYWKSLVSKSWFSSMDLPIWQVDFWDTQLRKSENYGSKCEYVKNNPVRAGLVTNANEWPYQGEINVLQWHD